MPISGEPKDNLMSQRPASPENSPSCAKEKIRNSELYRETRVVENQSCTGANIENVLETSVIPFERDTSTTEDNTSGALHKDCILEEAENKTSDLNKLDFSDVPERESPELRNVWPEMHPFRKSETIPITELKFPEIPGASTKYFKAELTDSVIVIKVSGKCENLYLRAKKYELIASSDTYFQNKMSGQINSSATNLLIISEADFQREISMEDANSKKSPFPRQLKVLKIPKIELVDFSDETSIKSLKCHHSISPIAKDMEIKRSTNNNDEHEILAETEFTGSPNNEIPFADVSLKDSDECENEKSQNLPDICIHEEKEAGNSSQIYEEKGENDTDTMTKSNVYESDENKSVASESEHCKEVSKSSEKTLSDTNETDAAPTRLRMKKAVASRYLTNLTADVIPKNVKNTTCVPLSSTLPTSQSKYDGRVSPVMSSLPSKNVHKTPHTSKTMECEKNLKVLKVGKNHHRDE